MTDAVAEVRVRTTVENHLEASADVTLETQLIDPDGNVVADSQRHHAVAGGGEWHEFDETLPVAKPKQWDVDAPHLYTARIAVKRHRSVCDMYEL